MENKMKSIKLFILIISFLVCLLLTCIFYVFQTKARLLEARIVIENQFYALNIIESLLITNNVNIALDKTRQTQNITAQYILFRDVESVTSMFAMSYFYTTAEDQLTKNQMNEINLFIDRTSKNFNMSAEWNLKQLEYNLLRNWFKFFIRDYPLWENTPTMPPYNISFKSYFFKNRTIEIDGETRSKD